MTEGTPIAYGALAKGTEVRTRDGVAFGTVEHVLQIPEEDVFDGLAVNTSDGLRFVDRDQILTITDVAVTCDLDDEQVRHLPQPQGPAVFHADGAQDVGSSLHDHFWRIFGRGHWKQEQD